MSERSELERSRRRVFAVALALGIYLAVELLSFGAYAVLEGGMMSLSSLQAERDRLAEAHTRVEFLSKKTRQREGEPRHVHALHPFTGYVNAPGSGIKHYDEKMNRFGYAGDDDMFVIADDDYVVAITGGSLAMRLFLDQRELIQQEVSQLEGIPVETVKVLCLGMSGFKQPQSLMAVVYFLSLGGRLDLLINVDGFNELNRLKKNLHPSYPTTWPRSVAETAQVEEIQIVGRIANLRDRSAANARLFSLLRFSPTANLIWLTRERSLDRQIAALNMQLDALADRAMRGASFSQVGPSLPEGTDVVAESMDIWVASSIQLAHLAQGNGFSYYHFLQPNQYVRGSKLFSAEELERALNRKERWEEGVALGYPKLRAREPELRSAGVDFTDMSGVFQDVEETVYSDNCCHLNKRGAELLARAIAERIAESREQEPRRAGRSRMAPEGTRAR